MSVIDLGAQLYTVREFTQNERDFEETARKVADIGYKTVQVSGIGAIPAQVVADVLAAHDLKCVITHTNPARIKDDTKAVIEEHKLMGANYIGIGMMQEEYRGSSAGVKQFVKDYSPAIKMIGDAGMKFMYHNHDFEFGKMDGRRVIEYLMDCSDIGFTLDTYWVQAGGGDPAEWLRTLKGRVDVIHVKDMIWRDGAPRMC
ncbi:MAG: sugar phosphate isomerase/epimerase [Oscillospiraceae bacterium]|jgi:sugar phosphate isomerase/epimerase|nr:sugar phosphate isomerase/epimerase [Oscillospiraceae bacterium]